MSKTLQRRNRQQDPNGVARVVGVVAGLVALTAGGIAAGFELEKRIVGSRFRRRIRAESTLGTLRSAGPVVETPDGVRLHTEVDETADYPRADGPLDPDLTVVLVHGYCLDLDCWHFQREHLRGRVRVVAYDQRSHGRSTRSAPEKCRIGQLAADLKQVLDEVAGPGPVLLVGHSMGGMTIMSFARNYPEEFGERVVGTVLISTAAGDMADFSPVPGLDGRVLSRVVKPLVTTLNRIPVVVSRARDAGSDIGYVATRRFAFGSPVPVDLVEFVSTMLGRMPLDVIADFYPAAFADLDETGAMRGIAQVESAVIGGEQDAITPVDHTRRIIELLPGAEALILDHCGHLSMMEYPEQVNDVIDGVVERALRHR